MDHDVGLVSSLWKYADVISVMCMVVVKYPRTVAKGFATVLARRASLLTLVI
jgi:hypothetical protein